MAASTITVRPSPMQIARAAAAAMPCGGFDEATAGHSGRSYGRRSCHANQPYDLSLGLPDLQGPPWIWV